MPGNKASKTATSHHHPRIFCLASFKTNQLRASWLVFLLTDNFGSTHQGQKIHGQRRAIQSRVLRASSGWHPLPFGSRVPGRCVPGTVCVASCQASVFPQGASGPPRAGSFPAGPGRSGAQNFGPGSEIQGTARRLHSFSLPAKVCTQVVSGTSLMPVTRVRCSPEETQFTSAFSSFAMSSGPAFEED